MEITNRLPSHELQLLQLKAQLHNSLLYYIMYANPKKHSDVYKLELLANLKPC